VTDHAPTSSAPADPRHVSRASGLRLPRLVASDVDHTLIRDDHTLSRATVEAVGEARRRGVAVVLASSRPPRGMLPYLLELGLADVPFVALQGGFVGSWSADGVLTTTHEDLLPLDVAHRVLAAAAEHGAEASWHRGDSWTTERRGPGIDREASIVGFEPAMGSLGDAGDGPAKVLLVTDPDRPEQQRALLEALPEGSTGTRSAARYVEVTRTGVDKATGLARLLADLEVRPEDVVALGDGDNDLAMFELVGLSVAPANASERVRDAATFVTDANDDDGVAVALRHLLGAPR